MVLDSHRWVPLPSVGFSSNSVGDESQDDVTPPSSLMEHPPLAVFVNGKSYISFSANFLEDVMWDVYFMVYFKNKVLIRSSKA